MKYSKLISILFTTFLFINFTPKIYAIEGGVSVSPTFLEITAKPGDTVNIEIEAENREATKLGIKPEIFNTSFDSNNELSFSADKYSAPASWINIDSDSEINLESGQKTRVPFKITIPKDTKPGSFYPIIALEFLTGKGEENIGANARIGTQIFLTVEGDNLNKNINIDEFIINNPFNFKPEVNFEISLINSGDIHFKPRLTLEVYDPNGVRQSNILTFNDKYKYLLPGQKISEEKNWKDDTIDNKFFPPIGKYRTVISIYDKDLSTPLNKIEKTFTVVPYQYITYSVFIILIAGGAVYIGMLIGKKKKKETKTSTK